MAARMTEQTTPEFGSDVVVAMLKAFGIEYAILNPGASFRGIHDSLVNWGDDHRPRIVEACHEAIAVAMAHGYAAATGRPGAAFVHDVVGLQNATIAIYEAWLDRAPVLVIGGTGPMDSVDRRPGVDWIHTALVQANLVRDFTKWDDQPSSVAAIPNSFIRAHHVATSAPAGPVYLCYDASLQERRLDAPIAIPDLAHYPAPTRLQADEASIERLASRLLAATSPVLIAEYAGRYPGAADALVELAELLGAPVLGRPGRFNIPSAHPLHVAEGWSDLVEAADVILAIEVEDLFGWFFAGPDRRPNPGPKPDAWLAHLTLGDVLIGSWAQDYQELAPLDEEIRGEAGVVLPRLLSICRDQITERGRSAAIERQSIIAARSSRVRSGRLAEAESKAASVPIASSHLALQLRRALRPYDWTIAKAPLDGWLWRILDVQRPDQWVGITAGTTIGTGSAFALGVALSHLDDAVIVVDVVGDGDFLYLPSTLWTAAHDRLPVLTIVNDNRSYGNSEKHGAHIARERGRSVESSWVGTRLSEPATDFATLARGFGIYSEGPIEDPADLLPALERAAAVVGKDRRPALVDVVCGAS